MSRSRFGGFRLGRIFRDWDVRRSPSAGNITSPASVQEFDYSKVQGIWNLNSTMQFPKKPKVFNLTFISSSTSTSQTISFPAGTLDGDLVVLLQFSTTVNPSTPNGWTNIVESTSSGSMLASCSYVIAKSTELTSSVVGLGGTTRKIMMTFRPDGQIISVVPGSINGQATTAAPSNQSLNMSGLETPVIGIVNYSYTGSAPTRGSTGLSMSEITGTNIISRYVIFNQGDTPSNGTITMSDAGTNALQSFYLQVI
jgi:hypothetical protein